MSLWKILVIIAAITMSVILVTVIITACVVAGYNSRDEERKEKDDAEIH